MSSARTEFFWRLTYWVAIAAMLDAFARGAASMFGFPPLLSFAVGIALAWNPLGLLFFIPVALDGVMNGYRWPFIGALLFTLSPLLPLLARDNWRAFRRAPDTTIRRPKVD